MKRLLIYIFITLFTLSCSAIAIAQDIPSKGSNRDVNPTVTQDYTIYWITTADTVTVAWDASEGAEGYEIIVRWTRGTTTLQTYAIGDTSGTTMGVRISRAGLFVVDVRAYKADPENVGQKLYSDWAVSNSIEYATVNGVAKAWVLMVSIAAPGPPGIN